MQCRIHVKVVVGYLLYIQMLFMYMHLLSTAQEVHEQPKKAIILLLVKKLEYSNLFSILFSIFFWFDGETIYDKE